MITKLSRMKGWEGLEFNIKIIASAPIDEVLNDPNNRKNSLAIQRAVAKKNGLSFAADLLEQAFGLNKKKEDSLHRVTVNT